MADFETIQFSSDGGIARITLNRPDRLNSFTRAMHAELREALKAADDSRVLVINTEGATDPARYRELLPS